MTPKDTSNVDDYYSSLSTATEKDDKPVVKKKLKLKPKKKVVVKKVVKPLEEKKSTPEVEVKSSDTQTPTIEKPAPRKSSFQVVSSAPTHAKQSSYKSSPRTGA